MPYAEANARLLGGIPVRTTDELQGFFDDATDEIDIVLGRMYETPITKATNGTDPISRQIALILKRINTYLASGRYILAVSAGGEDTALQAYGYQLVREALAALTSVLEGDMQLDAKRLIDVSQERRRPKIFNQEKNSNVDAFYEAFTRERDSQMFKDRRWGLQYGYAELEEDGDGYLAELEQRGD